MEFNVTIKKREIYKQHKICMAAHTVLLLIVLNQECSSTMSFFRKISSEMDIAKIIEKAQKHVYLNTEKEFYEQGKKKLFDFPVYELYHLPDDINFSVFDNFQNHEL